ncbi:MAG: sterol desaturase family protein [Burkholderiales bacterium]|nr:sterol desaturase family protein [Burkholderiales bacterium]
MEALLRLGAFAGVFVLVALWEALAPRRRRRFSRAQRWPHNLGLVALNAVVLRLLAPGAALAVALAAEDGRWGLLNLPALPAWIRVVLALLLLDLAIYLQHRLFHAVPALWRLHRVHHADPDYDVTTGLRFHPIEIGLSLAVKCAVIAAIGAPVLAVLAFEIVLNAAAMFNHANGRLPSAIDRWLRWLVVTPDMHRVHHSAILRETNSNFGFNLPWWDRLFGTYRAQPAAGHAAMRIGVAGLQGAGELNLARLLAQPLRSVDQSTAAPRAVINPGGK